MANKLNQLSEFETTHPGMKNMWRNWVKSHKSNLILRWWTLLTKWQHWEMELKY